jgi:hypothetical protein
MINFLGASILRYLPVEVAGQIFAFPMGDVVAVYRMDGEGQEEQDLSQPIPNEGINMQVLDLRRLFGTVTDPVASVQVVVISTHIGNCALLVDAVRPARTAAPTEIHALPYLVDRLGCPFSGVIGGLQTLTLIVDAQRLLDQLHHVVPELIVGGVHAT